MKERELAEMLDLHVREYVDPALQAIAKRFDEDAAELRAELDRVVGAIPVGKDGADGKDGEPGADGVNGVDGKDGKDGTSVTLDDIAPLIEEAVNSIPVPVDGKDGVPGVDGKDAPPITADQLVEALKSMPDVLDTAVKSYLAANPPAAGKDGRDGKDADPVSDEQIAKSVASHLALNPPAAGRDGRDGLPGIKGADGIDGKDGANGMDGLGFDDLTVEDDDDGTATIKFTRGEVVKEFPIRLPRVVDKGVFREGEFRKGDGVTWGGSFWIAQKDSPQGKPGEFGDTEWRLAVKHGRAGKDGAPGRDFTPPKPVKL